MVVLNRIYTRTGDDGTSALANGERRPKDDPRFEAIGAVDELNAVIGVARLLVTHDMSVLAETVGRVQNDLFDLGADLAVPETPGAREALRIAESQIAALENAIDALNADLEPLTSFVLPGGAPLAAALHHARTVARRAERAMCTLATEETVNPAAMRYVNRLSDFLFVAARAANDGGKDDVLWVPGRNR